MPQQQQQSVPQTPRQVQPQITYQPAPPSPYRERPPPLQPQPQVSDKPRRSPPSPIQFPIRQPEPLPQPPRIITSPSAQQPTRPPPTVRSTHARRQGSGSRTPSANSVPQLPNPNPNPSRPPAITAMSNTTVSSSRPSSTDVVINLPLVAKTAGPTRPASKPPQIAPKPDEPTRRGSFVEHLFHHHHHHHEAKEEQPPQQPSPALTRPKIGFLVISDLWT
ncbi:hypothetical protein FRB96_001202 [Tulasnella sp. 330]|nr:hypothetical protein FRB96_001202 [Tulasnella sp. 330]